MTGWLANSSAAHKISDFDHKLYDQFQSPAFLSFTAFPAPHLIIIFMISRLLSSRQPSINRSHLILLKTECCNERFYLHGMMAWELSIDSANGTVEKFLADGNSCTSLNEYA